MRVHIGTAIRVGDFVYASSGDFGPAFLTAINIKTGKIAWQDRSFSRAQLLYADGKLSSSTRTARWDLPRATPDGLKVLAKASILENLAWTPPTLVGTKLYVARSQDHRGVQSRILTRPSALFRLDVVRRQRVLVADVQPAAADHRDAPSSEALVGDLEASRSPRSPLGDASARPTTLFSPWM